MFRGLKTVMSRIFRRFASLLISLGVVPKTRFKGSRELKKKPVNNIIFEKLFALFQYNELKMFPILHGHHYIINFPITEIM